MHIVHTWICRSMRRQHQNLIAFVMKAAESIMPVRNVFMAAAWVEMCILLIRVTGIIIHWHVAD